MEDFTTRLSPSTLWPVSFRYHTTSGHTPKIFATTSTRLGMERSLVMMALRNAGSGAIQSRVSAPSTASQQISALRMGQGSQTQTEQSTRGNASSAGDQIWGTPRAWHGTHFPGNLQKHLQEHANLHAETHRCIWTSSIQIFVQNRSLRGSVGAEAAQRDNTNTTKCGALPSPHHHPNL